MIVNGNVESGNPYSNLALPIWCKNGIKGGCNAVPLTDQSILPFNGISTPHSTFACLIDDYNISPDNQYLVIFSLRNPRQDTSPINPTAQFFVFAEFIRAEEIIGQQQVALLIDAPGSGFYTLITVRLAGPSPGVWLAIKGVNVYLI